MAAASRSVARRISMVVGERRSVARDGIYLNRGRRVCSAHDGPGADLTTLTHERVPAPDSSARDGRRRPRVRRDHGDERALGDAGADARGDVHVATQIVRDSGTAIVGPYGRGRGSARRSSRSRSGASSATSLTCSSARRRSIPARAGCTSGLAMSPWASSRTSWSAATRSCCYGRRRVR